MKEINHKKVIIDAIVSSIILAIIVYVLVGPLNNSMQVFLKGVAENNGAVSAVIYALPVILIFELSSKLGVEVMRAGNANTKKRKK